MTEIRFSINGKEHKVSSVEADTFLVSYLRNNVNLRGTKAMCHEGGCGACVVSVSAIHPVTNRKEVFSVNSCLVSIMSCHGWEITTVEGIGNKRKGYHPIQKRLASFNGTQCGYCSPGWVMNMYSLLESRVHNLTMKEVENSFAGSMCRCTGYRPILDAFKSFSNDADQSLIDKVLDIEDVEKVRMCAKSGQVCKCPSSCNDKIEDGFCVVSKHDIVENKLLLLEDAGTKWYKVYKVQEILNIFDQEGTDSYMLVAGNTAKGVYPMNEIPRIMIDISSVAELRKHEKTSNLSLGANMTLNEIMEVFQDYGNSNDAFKYLLQMYRHMDLVAHVPLRNIGTLAGNLSIKHQHNEFQSDMFLLLEAIGATLTIVDKHGTYIEVTLHTYLKTDMAGKLIYRVNLPELYPNYILQSYKIMPRAQNAHAIVNAAFLFKFNSDKTILENVKIVYGGIRPEFDHAIATELFLSGKNLFSKPIMKIAIETLFSEILPISSPPEPSPGYRKIMAVGLFYKSIIHISPPDLVDDKYKSGGEEVDRPVSSGKQKFDTNKEVWPLNQPIPKIEALVQCSGEAVFMNDIPTQPNEVYAAFVLSNVHDGQIVKIDGTEALADKGVISLFTASDIPGVNNFTSLVGLFTEVEEVLCSGKILFHGQPVAIVVAETERLAKLAAEKVKVTYKNTGANPPILTIRDALKSPSAKNRIVKDKTIEPTAKGDDVKKVIKGTFDIFGQYHYTMEVQTCVCIPIEDGMDVYSSSQWPDLTNVCVANVLNVPVNTINVNIRRLGGGYGSKISRCSQIAAACAVAASNLNRTVRFVLPIETNMSAIGKRLPCSSDYEVGVNDDGKIQYLRNIFYEDNGCSHNETVTANTAVAFTNCYDNSTWFVEANSVLTDTPSNTWCRAPATTEAVAMIEHIMDHIATATGKDRIDVRLANLSKNDNPIPDLIKTVKESSNYDERAAKVEKFNDTNRWKKRGICLTPLQYGLDYYGNFSSLISVYHADGTVAVSHAGVEMGQGLNTKVAQVCAHTLGIPLDTVQVKPTNNVTAPNAAVTGGSIGSEVCCFATIKACEILLERLAPIKKNMNDPTWKELISKAYFSGVDLCAHYMFTENDVQAYKIWGATVVEVEVDMLTGNHQILRVDILEDTGESLSPIVDVGQVEGAYIMGIGYYTSESLVYDKTTGALLSNRTWTYKPPGVKDIPIDFRVEFRRNAPNPAGVLRSKATGEPPLNMAFGIVSAIRQAITSTRADNGLPANEWYHIDMPLTTENIILATKTSINDFET